MFHACLCRAKLPNMPYLRILKNSAFMASAQSLSIVSQIVRSKIIAWTLGAPGIGILGIMNSFAGNVATVSGWGLSTSGARMIAVADKQQKPSIISAVIIFGRYLSLVGILLAILTCLPMSRVTFGSSLYAYELALVGLSAPFLVASGVFTAILQAEGDIKSIAIGQSIGAIVGLVLGVALILFFGMMGVAAAILVAAAMPTLFLWLKARPLLRTFQNTVRREDITRLIRMGGALMLVGWLAQLSAYLVRLIIIKDAGLEASGHYQAAFSIASTMPMFILASMGSDFFPRIAGARDEQEAREVAENQVRATLLIGLPVIASIICLGRICLRILYSQEFEPATHLLSWMGWGAFCRLVSWPFGYWLLARGTGRHMVIMELIANVSSVILPLLLMPAYGIEGAAMGFLGSAVLYLLIMVFYVRMRSGSWLGVQVTALSLIASGILAVAQMSTKASDAYFKGVVPVLLITLICIFAYHRHIKATES